MEKGAEIRVGTMVLITRWMERPNGTALLGAAPQVLHSLLRCLHIVVVSLLYTQAHFGTEFFIVISKSTFTQSCIIKINYSIHFYL